MQDVLHNPYDVYQILFRAETPDHNITISYDDVEWGVVLSVTFKNRWTVDGFTVNRIIQTGTVAKAMERLARFLQQHPIGEPRCYVDY